MKKSLALLLCLLLGCTGAAAEGFDLSAEASAACAELLSGNCAALCSRFDGSMKAAVDETAMAQSMQTLEMMYGAFVSAGELQCHEASRSASVELFYAQGTLALNMAFDEQGRICGLTITPAAPAASAEKPLPDGAAETQTLLFPGTERELNACILSPAAEDAPYVIFGMAPAPAT